MPMTPDKILYEASVTATGGRAGRVEAADGALSMALSVPKGLGGPGGEGSNPEQLFAAGYAACFMGAVGLVMRQRSMAMPAGATVTAIVGIGPVAVGYALAVELAVNLPGLEPAVATDVVDAAHQRCPYSHATRGNVDVRLRVM